MEVTYRVDGMTCGGCSASLTRALDQVGLADVCEVSHERGDVRVAGEHDPAVVERAVKDAGFEFIGREGPPR